MTRDRQSDQDELCRVCGNKSLSQIIKILSEQVTVKQCTSCQASFLYPMPHDNIISKHYERYYLSRNPDPLKLKRLIDMHGPIASFIIERMSKPGVNSILDYGFGNGAFLIHVACRGHNAYGADISKQNVEQLSAYCATNRIQISSIDLSKQSLSVWANKKFDVITMFQVIEHLCDPISELRKIASLQEPGGLLYIECPNDRAAFASAKKLTRITKNRRLMWGSLKYPEHLYGYSKRSIKCLLQAASYQIEECNDYSYCDGLHQVEAEFWWPPAYKNPTKYTIYELIRSIIPLFDKCLSRFCRSGSGLYILGRKKA